MTWVIASLFFFIGACWGSFLYVVCYRLPRQESFIRGRSMCAHCAKQLKLWEVIPIFSYCVLRGRCRHCRAIISWHYLAVEVFTGILFFAGWLFYGASWEFLLFIIEISVLLLVFWIDLYTGWVYEMIVAPAIVFIFAFQLILGNDPLLYAIGVLVGMAFFALQYLVSRGTWIGKGDIRIGALMGAILGWKILIIALAISYFFGGGIALYLILTHRKTRKDSIPFGPFLVVGTFIAMIWGERILEWYLGLIGF